MNHTDTAYIAGLFDSGGHVEFTQRWEKRGKKKYKFWRITCSIASSDKYILEWIQDVLGMGSLCSKKVKGKRKPQWRWQCSFREALQFALMIWPHIQIKIHKIEKIIDHYSIEKITDHYSPKFKRDEEKKKPTAQIINLDERRKKCYINPYPTN